MGELSSMLDIGAMTVSGDTVEDIIKDAGSTDTAVFTTIEDPVFPSGGIAVLNTGHVHPRVRAAVERQLGKFSHTCFMVTPYESGVALAEKLNAIVPISGPTRSMFVTTGAEAVENAVKIAKQVGFQNIGMQRRHTVDTMASNDGQMGHEDVPLRVFLKDGQPGRQVGFLRKTLAERLEKTVVDFVYDL